VPRDIRLGWQPEPLGHWRELGAPHQAGRVARIDRGWSTVLMSIDEPPARVRNMRPDIAVGDFVVVSDDGERVETLLDRHSAFVRRASFEGQRAVAHTLAANIDVVLLVHMLTSPPNQRRLERELVLAWDSGAKPVVLLTKTDLVDDPTPTVDALRDVAPDVAVITASPITGQGVERVRSLAEGGVASGLTIALLGASGVGKSTLVNALVGNDRQATGLVRGGDGKGRHTTVAGQLVRLPGGGWLVDTPGLRAVSLWSSGRGIERAFADVFELMDRCRFRDCKHDQEPGCAVNEAVALGTLDPRRLESMKRLVAEEAALEDEQRAKEKAMDRRGVRKPKPPR
jgi:ribosome biogenesis GTPase